MAVLGPAPPAGCCARAPCRRASAIAALARIRRAPSADARAARHDALAAPPVWASCRLDGPRGARGRRRGHARRRLGRPELASDCRVLTVRALRRLRRWRTASTGAVRPQRRSSGSTPTSSSAPRAAGQPRQPDDLPSLARAAWDRGVREDGRGLARALREAEAGLKRRLDDRAYRGRRADVRLSFVPSFCATSFVRFTASPMTERCSPRRRRRSAQSRPVIVPRRRRLGLAEGKLVAAISRQRSRKALRT